VGGGADINGMNGGYIGVGIDEFGNFSNGTEGRIGGVSTPSPRRTPSRCVGPGQGLTGYNYLGGTGNLGSTPSPSPVRLRARPARTSARSRWSSPRRTR